MEIRIAKPPEVLSTKLPRHEQAFYLRYAEIVRIALSMPEVQKIMLLMATNECLNLRKIRDVRVMIFPHGSADPEQEHRKRLKLDSKGLCCSGTYNPLTGTISIYPIFTNPERQAVKLLTNETIIAGITLTAISAFFEEILHTKYDSEYMAREHLSRQQLEKEARRIADRYVDAFIEAAKS